MQGIVAVRQNPEALQRRNVFAPGWLSGEESELE
jgi:hypothetical protein